FFQASGAPQDLHSFPTRRSSDLIPFAAPPVGNLRWKPPQPVVPWTGVRQATAFGTQCMQGTIFGDIVFDRPASEDCLYLNVWTPDRKSTRLNSSHVKISYAVFCL